MVWTFGYRQFQVLPRLGRDAEEPRLELAPAEAGAQGGREGARGEGKGEGEEGQEGGEEGRRARQDRGGQGGGQGQLFPPPPTFLNTNNPFSHCNFFFLFFFHTNCPVLLVQLNRLPSLSKSRIPLLFVKVYTVLLQF